MLIIIIPVWLKSESLKNNRVEEIKDDDDEKKWSEKIDKAWGEYDWGS
jgi:hypothetical protein